METLAVQSVEDKVNMVAASKENPGAVLVPMREMRKLKEQKGQRIKCIESPFAQKLYHWVAAGVW